MVARGILTAATKKAVFTNDPPIITKINQAKSAFSIFLKLDLVVKKAKKNNATKVLVHVW